MKRDMDLVRNLLLATERADCGLTTSQNATAPKRSDTLQGCSVCLTTSQNATAPKLDTFYDVIAVSLTTSQNATAPKPDAYRAIILQV